MIRTLPTTSLDYTIDVVTALQTLREEVQI